MLTAGLLFHAPSSARAAVSLRLNSAGVISSPTTLGVDGIVTSTGDWTDLKAAQVCITYDPTKVSLSNAQPATGWALQIAENHATEQVYQAIFTTIAEQITTTGPLMTFTATPVSGSVDTSDCTVLSLRGGTANKLSLVCELVSGDFYAVWIQDACPDDNALYLGDNYQRPHTGGMGIMSMESETPCYPDVISAARILKIAGGMVQATLSDNRYVPLAEQDLQTLDYNLDGRITIEDAILAIRIPCTGPANAVWSKGFLGSARKETTNPMEVIGNAANATGSPAIADLDGNGRLEAVFPMGTQNGWNYSVPAGDLPGEPHPHGPGNPNRVYVLEDLTGMGGYGLKVDPANMRMRDAPMGVSLGDLDSDGVLEIAASNFQDSRDVNGNLFPHSYSRPYVWRSNGNGYPNFASTFDPDNTTGQSLGHSNTASPIWNLDNTGGPELLFPSLGESDPNAHLEYKGTIKGIYGNGVEKFTTQLSYPGAPTPLPDWMTYGDPTKPTLTNPDDAEFSEPPVLMKQNGTNDRIVVGAAYSGIIYAWHNDGTTVSGFPVMTDTNALGIAGRAIIHSPAVAADLDRDGDGEILVPTGDYAKYAGSTSSLDGQIKCWNNAGQLLWQWPATGFGPAVSGGVAVGRLRGPLSNPCVVAADAAGYVTALDPTNGQQLWQWQVPITCHRYYQFILSPPLIADLNGDGYQDVIVGSVGGHVYLLDGNPSATTRVLPNGDIATFQAPDTLCPGGSHVNHEQVVGLALGPLNASESDHAILLVTTGRAAFTNPNPVGGHAILVDLGTDSWDAANADWPQFQQNEKRTGYWPES